MNIDKIKKVIKDRINEINNEEWFIPDEKNIKYYCIEELDRILYKLIEEIDKKENSDNGIN